MNTIAKTLTPNWYVVYTYPNSEKKVHNVLNQKAIESFLPLQTVERQWSDRKKTLEVPLFPNYLFVNTTYHKRFEVLTVPGVVRYVAFENSPVIVSEKEINTVKSLITIPGLAKEEVLEAGDYVRIIYGPFSGMKGVLIERKGKTRFGIKLNTINQALSIEVCTSSLEKIDRTQFFSKAVLV